jgi:hypothetical protein
LYLLMGKSDFLSEATQSNSLQNYFCPRILKTSKQKS